MESVTYSHKRSKTLQTWKETTSQPLIAFVRKSAAESHTFLQLPFSYLPEGPSFPAPSVLPAASHMQSLRSVHCKTLTWSRPIFQVGFRNSLVWRNEATNNHTFSQRRHLPFTEKTILSRLLVSYCPAAKSKSYLCLFLLRRLAPPPQCGHWLSSLQLHFSANPPLERSLHLAKTRKEWFQWVKISQRKHSIQRGKCSKISAKQKIAHEIWRSAQCCAWFH